MLLTIHHHWPGRALLDRRSPLPEFAAGPDFPAWQPAGMVSPCATEVMSQTQRRFPEISGMSWRARRVPACGAYQRVVRQSCARRVSARGGRGLVGSAIRV